MPELPEVETVKRSIQPYLLNQSFKAIGYREIFKFMVENDQAIDQVLLNKTILNIKRLGKYLVLTLDAGFLVVHLGMTGKLYLKDSTYQLAKHDHLWLSLSNDYLLVYEDVRRFGRIVYSTKNPELIPPLSKLGIDPTSQIFDEQVLKDILKSKAAPIKEVLLDQQAIAGIGNIYADEILFASGIRPRKQAKRLTRAEIGCIVLNSKRILEDAILAGGSSIRDYRDGFGKQGAFQLSHKVYGRTGKACYLCGCILKDVQVAGRRSVYCPSCQKS